MYVNENIKNTERIFPMQGRLGYLRYDMNENPTGLPLAFVETVKKDITPDFLAVYPEPDKFLKKYAAYLGVNFENVVATNGSDMAIRYLLEIFGEVGKEVVTATPSFEMYGVNCRILGYRHVPVSYDADLTMNVENILSAITNNTRIVVMLNPNNPLGNVYTPYEAETVIQKARSVGALVIIDEAYHYFYKETLLNLALKYDNVALLRTFSKLFSLAALRLGVIIASPEIIHYVYNAKVTFEVNSLALLFGEKLLEHPEIEAALIKGEQEGKAYTLTELRKAGYKVRDCQGNFVLIHTNKNPHTVAEKLMKEHKILVKTFSHPLLKDYIRVSTGQVAAMEILLATFLEVDDPNS